MKEQDSEMIHQTWLKVPTYLLHRKYKNIVFHWRKHEEIPVMRSYAPLINS